MHIIKNNKKEKHIFIIIWRRGEELKLKRLQHINIATNLQGGGNRTLDLHYHAPEPTPTINDD